MNIEYIEGDIKLLDLVKPLWEELNEHHEENSKYFKESFSKFTFEMRKQGFLEKSKIATFYIKLAKDVEAGEFIGYAITSITEDSIGEIESIYVKSNYRGFEIGDNLMKSSLNWLEEKGVKEIKIGVVGGNEKMLSFYNRYGFYPAFTILKNPILTNNNNPLL